MFSSQGTVSVKPYEAEVHTTPDRTELFLNGYFGCHDFNI